MFNILPFEYTDAKYAAVAAVTNAVWPDNPSTVEEWKHNDQTRDPNYMFHRLVVEAENKIVAVGIYCDPWWSMKPGKYYINMNVHPNYQRRGIGAAFYNHLMDCLAEYNPATIMANTREDQTGALRFLEKRGFKRIQRDPVSHLDVPGLDHARFAGIQESVAALGIRIQSIAELQTVDPDWKHKYWDLEWELLQDVPTPDPLTRQTFETFEKRELGNPNFIPKANYIALDGEQWVGMSALWSSSAEPDKLYTGLTGVVRSHRRKKIATAMKLRAIAYAQQRGTKMIETDNEENNPMYQLNLHLGFRSKPAWIVLEKKVTVRQLPPLNLTRGGGGEVSP